LSNNRVAAHKGEIMNADDETNVTDIELLPDGRVCVFGTSIEVLEVLDQLQGGADSSLSARLQPWRKATCQRLLGPPSLAVEDSDV
jgi:hypothetical protein